MTKYRKLPSRAELRSRFDYDQDTGVLTWRHRPEKRPQWNGKFAGKVAGSPCTRKNGSQYWIVNIDKEPLLAHRIIWKWMTGKDAPHDIDHADCDGINNRWENLRLATKHENLRNCRRHKVKKHDLPKGVSKTGNSSFRACIYINSKQTHLGSFRTPDAAHAAYAAAATKHFGQFARIA